MNLSKIITPDGNDSPAIKNSLYKQFPSIGSDPTIQSGWPHIKGTRILALDVLRAQFKGFSLDQIIMEFKEIGVTVNHKQLEEALKFSVAWLNSLVNEKIK